MLHREGEEAGELRPRAAFTKTGCHTAPPPCPDSLGHLQNICISLVGVPRSTGTWGQVAARGPPGAAAACAPPE